MMNSFWKAVPVLSLVLSVAQADDLGLGELAVKDKTTMTRSRQQQVPCGVVEGNNCYARACSQTMGGSFEFDFLYWRSENQGFVSGWYFNNVVTLAGASGTAASSSAHVIRPDKSWAPGFRIGAGWNSDYDRWDLFVDWTWYQNCNNSVTGPEEVILGGAGQGYYSAKSGIINNTDLIGPYSSVAGRYNLWHNCWDAELGRAFYVTKKLSLRPHWGARAAVNKQKNRTSFWGPASILTVDGGAVNSAVLGINDKVVVRNKFWGLGPRTGLNADWHIGKGFSFVGRGSVSLLFGQMKWKSEDIAPTSATNATPVKWGKSGEMFQTLVPNLQLFLGFQWASCFNCEEIWAGLNVGWETNYWWNQYAVATPPQNWATNDALSMEGLTVNFHLDY